MFLKLKRHHIALILLLGLSLRCFSLLWNDRIHGDVNLFALTAQELVRNDELRYPMKIDYSKIIPWETLHSPQSQHPPLWSFAAGIIGKIVGSENTYGILQWISFFVGIAIILTLRQWLNLSSPETSTTVLALAALSPMLVDFSGNGSQYSLGTLFLLLNCKLLSKDTINAKTAILAGSISGLAFLTHGAFLLMIFGVAICFLKNTATTNQKLICLGFSLASFLAIISPMLWHKANHFGSPFHNLNYVYIGGLLGQLSIRMDEHRIFWDFDFSLTLDAIKNYFSHLGSAGISFVLHLVFEWSPFGVVLGIIGFRNLRTHSPVMAKVILCLGISYLLPVLGWASFKYRFLAPILPIAFVLTAIGFQSCRKRGGFWTKWGKLAMIGTFSWFCGAWVVSSILTGSPTRYYAFDLKHKEDYSEMISFSNQIKKLDRGTIIGSAKSLDGGIEGVYIHQFPYIHARGFPWEYIQRIREDFDATYFWTDQVMMGVYGENLEHLEPVLSHGKFRLFRFPATQ
jgi:hypothetical protein